MSHDEVLTPLYDNLTKTHMKHTDDHSDSETHYETITEGRKKKFICSFPDCQKVFRFKSEIERHISVHSEAKPHACTFDKCNKSFKRADALENHIRSQHTGEAVLACQYPGCGLSFTTSSKLRYHTILHVGEKPYKCSVPGCDRAFVTLSQMKQHERSAIAHKKLTVAQSEAEAVTRANSAKVDDEEPVEDFTADEEGQGVIYDMDSTAGNFYNNFAVMSARVPESLEYQPAVRKIVKLDTQLDQEQAELEEKEALLKRVCFENDALKDRLISTKKLISEMKMKFDQISIFPGENSAKSGFALPKHEAFIPSFEWVNGLEWGLFGNNGVEQAFMAEDRSTGHEIMDRRGSEGEEDFFTNFNYEDVPFLQMK